MQTLRQDVSYALQQTARGKGVAAMVVLMMGLGIGANTAIFGLFKTTSSRPPFQNVERLVRIVMTPPDRGESSPWIAIPEYVAIQDQNTTFEAIGASDDSALTLGSTTEGEVGERLVSPRFKAGVGVANP